MTKFVKLDKKWKGPRGRGCIWYISHKGQDRVNIPLSQVRASRIILPIKIGGEKHNPEYAPVPLEKALEEAERYGADYLAAVGFDSYATYKQVISEESNNKGEQIIQWFLKGNLGIIISRKNKKVISLDSIEHVCSVPKDSPFLHQDRITTLREIAHQAGGKYIIINGKSVDGKDSFLIYRDKAQ